MALPFDTPDDLTTVSDEELSDLTTKVREHAQTLLSDENADTQDLVDVRDLNNAITAENNRRREEAARKTSAKEDLSAALNDSAPSPTLDSDTTESSTESGTESGNTEQTDSRTSSNVTASRSRGTLDTPPESAQPSPVTMTTASDVPGFNSGMPLENFNKAAEAIDARLQTYSGGGRSKTGQSQPREIAPNRYVTPGRSAVRHGAVMFRRDYPSDLRIEEGQGNPLAVLDHAANERRLPGGNLKESAKQLVESGRSLTAAVGWCAPSEVIYDLCELETVDGILDLPEVQATRGGFQLPQNGGPDFSTIWDGLGNEGDVILTEYEIESGSEKICLEIPCPDFEDVRLDAAYVCLTGSLLQRRGYPEVIQRFSRGSMVALAHKINEDVISKIAAASSGPTTIPTITDSDDAASALLGAVELAIEDTKYRNRMSRAATLEVVLPAWVLAVVRAALSRRRGISQWNVTDAEILSAFATRNAVPRFVYDWQDAFSGLAAGPGGDTPITSFPDDVQFLVYPAGTWTKAVRDVVNLDTIYDNALLTSNNYTAIFAEDGFNVLQTCPDSRLYQVAVDPAGIVGCCSGS